MSYRIFVKFVLTLCILVLISGCWDTKDINKRYLPAVIGVGQGKVEKYKIILQVPNTNGQTQILETEAKSISKGIDLIRTNAEKSIDLVHLRLFLISEKIAKKGINDVINFAVGANDISIKGMVAIVDGDFKETLYHQIKPTPEVSSYDYFSEESGWTPNVSIVRVWEAYRISNSYSEDIAIPLLRSGTDTLFTFGGSAAMQGDRMVGRISPEETLLYNIFKGRYTGGTIELEKDTSVVVKKSKVSHKTKWTGTGPVLKSKVHLDVIILESSENKSNEQLGQAIEKSIKQSYEIMLGKLKKTKADVLGIGLIFRPHMSENDIKDWKKKWFPQLKQELEVTVNVQNNIYFKEQVSYKNNKK